MAMELQLKLQWIDALRSGKYKQGKGRLCEGDEYCCLGVLADIDPRIEWQSQTAVYRGSIGIGLLPPLYAEKIGLKDIGTFNQYELANRNDDGVTFDEIADIIEQEL